MNEHNTEPFALAVKMIREKRHTGLEIEAALEYAATSDRGVRSVVCEARKYVKQTDEAAFECAVEAFKQGQSHFEVSKTLVKCGLHPFDSDVLAFRAQQRAAAEMAEESLDDGLSTLKGAETPDKVG